MPSQHFSYTYSAFLLGCACLVAVQDNGERKYSDDEDKDNGGWVKQDPFSSPIYWELADFAVYHRVSGLRYYDIVVNILEVQTQKANHTNYKLKLLVASSDCIVDVHPYTNDCQPRKGVPYKICLAHFEEVLTSYQAFLISYKCHAKEDDRK
ncbi:cystatin-2-like isoform X2 [Ornithodoros turicata]|uniref:cystatin-2-like isoform X2 n=1 Tax=Ornithodoros turicata TaxID=34597 RepID=UPI00313945CF